MTEETPAPEAPAAVDTTPPESTEDTTPNPNREAAKYRTQLREAEAQREQLAQRLQASHRREVERLAAASLADPTDLWQHTTLDDLTDESGDLDAGKVTDAVTALLEAKPHYQGNRTPKPDPSQGANNGGVREPRIGAIFGGN